MPEINGSGRPVSRADAAAISYYNFPRRYKKVIAPIRATTFFIFLYLQKHHLCRQQ